MGFFGGKRGMINVAVVFIMFKKRAERGVWKRGG
jgi:hypothetical protein